MAPKGINPFLDIPVVSRKNTGDPTISPLDVQQTTFLDSLRTMMEKHYTPQQKVSDLQNGVIMKIVKNPNEFEYDSAQMAEIQSYDNPNNIPLRYKVFVLGEVGSWKSPPESFEDEEKINLLSDYWTTIQEPLAIGDIIEVNIKTRSIEKTFNKTINTDGSKTAPNSGESQPPSAQDTFSQPTPAPTGKPDENLIVTINNIPQDETEGESWVAGRFVGKIKLKPVISFSGQRLRSDVADKFNEMAKVAAQQGIRVFASSGFRDQQKQIQIYNDRYQKPYPERPSQTNKLKPDMAAVAYPGTSNHQSGIAVDIDVGKNDGTQNRYAGPMGKHPTYLWLVQNAENYGFNNLEGRTVNEPWHWTYKSQPSANKEEGSGA